MRNRSTYKKKVRERSKQIEKLEKLERKRQRRNQPQQIEDEAPALPADELKSETPETAPAIGEKYGTEI